MYRYLRIFLLLLAFSGAYSVCGQTIEQLREEIRQAEEEIRRTNELIARTKDKQKDGTNQIKLVLSKIDNRKKIVSNLDKQIVLIRKSIADNNRTVTGLDKDLDELKKEYTAMIREGYRNFRLNNYLLFLFSASDFNDLARRMYYIRRYSQMRENKARQIQDKTTSIGLETRSLEEKQAELDIALADKNKEIKALAAEEAQHRKLVNDLKQEETQLNRTLAEKQAQINQLQNRIQQIIEEEARRQRGETLTEAEEENLVRLTGQFDQNKGKLPFPIRGGVIVDRFGTHAHPSIKGAVVNNKGINIAAENRSNVTAVFDGTVSNISAFQGRTIVILRHGSYMTVFGNLSEVNVKPGDKISINQRIGKILSDNNTENGVLFFQIWKDTTPLNPEEWLKQ